MSLSIDRMNAQLREYFVGRVFVKASDAEFVRDDGVRLKLDHDQDCCEAVWLEDTVGDWADLEGEPITLAECCHSDAPEGAPAPSDGCDSQTWTFYKFATRKGYVDLRFCGESNGYYSEEVDLFIFGTYLKHRWDKPRWWVFNEELVRDARNPKAFTTKES